MIIKVKIKLKSKEEKLEKISDKEYIISGKDEGDANTELVALLSRNLGLPIGRIVLKQDKDVDKVFELF